MEVHCFCNELNADISNVDDATFNGSNFHENRQKNDVDFSTCNFSERDTSTCSSNVNVQACSYIPTCIRPRHRVQLRHTQALNKSNLVNIPRHSTSNDQQNQFTVLYLNAQSCRNKATLISDYILERRADLVFITETWFRPNGDEVKICELTPPGYCLHSNPRGSRGGGIAILYRESLQGCITFSGSDYVSFELSKMQMLYKDFRVTILCLYRPPPNKINQVKISQFMSEFSHLLDSYASSNTNLIVVGDINFHYESSIDSNVNFLKTLLTTHSLTQLIDKPTHKRNHTIDWVIVRDDQINMIHNLLVRDDIISDHFPVSFNLNMKKPETKMRTVQSRHIKLIDIKEFKENISHLKFSQDDIAISYFTELSCLLDKHAPLTTRRVTDRPSAPWLTAQVKEAKKKQRQAERQWRKSGLTIHRQMFIDLREQTKAIVANAKSDYINKQIQSCPSNKQLFKVVKHLTGKSNQTTIPNNIDPENLPCSFSSFFNEKIQSIRLELDQSNDKPCFEPFHGEVFHSFSLVTEAEVLKILKESSKKSCILDPLPASILFECLDELTPIITELINYSLKTGVVPPSFKEAVVYPLLKKANLDTNMLKNYRPVSNLPFVSKILEKVVLRQFLDHLSKHDLMEPFQSAYRAHHSTETALLSVMNDLLLACDRGKVSLLSMLDLSAAFDTIDHGILLERLKTTFGVSGSVLGWFESYLTGRTQFIVVNQQSSKPTTLQYGVPQGSVLGPVLFSVYLKPLGNLIQQFNMIYHMYADDSQLHKSEFPRHFPKILDKVQQTVSGIKTWMTTNKLKLNDEKTELIPIGTNHKLKEISSFTSLDILGSTIHFSRTVKNLGSHFDSSLTMEAHINSLCKLSFLELRRISHIRPFLTDEATKSLVSSFVLSRIDYCNSLFVGISSNLLNRVQRVQNSAARLILKKRKYDHATPMLKHLHWLPIRARIEYKIATLCFRCLNSIAPSYLKDLITPYTPARSLRSSDALKLVVPRVRLESYGKRSFAFAAPSVWNALPLSLRRIATLSSFKTKLKTFLFQKYLQSGVEIDF